MKTIARTINAAGAVVECNYCDASGVLTLADNSTMEISRQVWWLMLKALRQNAKKYDLLFEVEYAEE